MIKTLLLMGALTLAPLNTEGDTTEPPTQETDPTTPSEGETEPTTPSEEETTPTEEEKKDDSTKTDEEKKEDTTTPTTDETKNEIKEWLSKFFEPQQVAMIMTWITYIGTIIGLIYKFYQMAKEKNLTAKNVKDEIMKELGDKVDESVANQLTTTVLATNKMIKNQNEVLALLTKVMALSQENTPESRVAILELISQLGVVKDEEIEEMKETINKEVEDKKAVEEETNKSVDTIIENHKVEDNGTSI